MTYKECLEYAISAIKSSGVDEEDSTFDAYQLMKVSFGLDKGKILMNSSNNPEKTAFESFKAGVERRVKGEPLQYILGEWGFYDLTFKVGPGVLIPRPETEILVDEAINFLKTISSGATVFDLCAGSGCIGITIAKKFPECNVVSIEKSPCAFNYLEKNIKLYNAKNVTPILGDILHGFSSFGLKKSPDIILSNPPYIRTKEIGKLQREVLNEPVMALDGGEDGLLFYHSLVNDWFPYVNNGGMMICECGEDEAEEIEKIFSICSGEIIKIRDYSGIYRVVSAKKC